MKKHRLLIITILIAMLVGTNTGCTRLDEHVKTNTNTDKIPPINRTDMSGGMRTVAISEINEDALSLSFDIIYNAPHVPYVNSFRYFSGASAFIKRDNFVRGMHGYMELNSASEILRHTQNMEHYGQFVLSETFEDMKIEVFDGWRTANTETNMKIYTILKDTQLYSIEVDNNFYASNIFKHDDTYYLLFDGEFFIEGRDISHIQDTREQTRASIQNRLSLIDIKNGEEIRVLEDYRNVNLTNIIHHGDNIFITYAEGSDIKVMSYNLTTKEAESVLNISSKFNLTVPPVKFVHNNELFMISMTNRQEIFMLRLKNFEVVEVAKLDDDIFLPVFHHNARVFDYNGTVYTFIPQVTWDSAGMQSESVGSIATFDLENNTLIPILSFKSENNEDNTFLSAIYNFSDGSR